MARLIFLFSFFLVFLSSAVGFYAKEFTDPINWLLVKQSFAVLVPSLLVMWISHAVTKRQKKRGGSGRRGTARSSKRRQTQGRESREERKRPLEDVNAARDLFLESNDVEAFYRLGCHDLSQNTSLGSAPAGLAFVLPLTVSAARRQAGKSVSKRLPDYDSLTIAERDAVELMHTCLTGSAMDINAVSETTLAGRLFEPMYILFREAERFWGLDADKPDVTIRQRILERGLKPKKRISTKDPKEAMVILESASRILQAVAEAGHAPDVTESKAIRNEIEAVKPLLLKRASRISGAPWATARSWFGGRPRLGRLDWPRSRDTGRPMLFLAQVDLAAIHRLTGSALLPETGWLAFFIGTEMRDCAVRRIEEMSLPGITPAPAGLPVSLDWMEKRLSISDGDAETGFLFPYFPAEISRLDMGYDAEDEERRTALARHAPLREFQISAREVIEKAGTPPPVFGYTARHFALSLKEACAQTETIVARHNKRSGEDSHDELRAAERTFHAVGDEVSGWATRFALWEELSEEDDGKLRDFYDRLRADDLRRFTTSHLPMHFEDLHLPVFLEMMSSGDDLFGRLPPDYRTVLSEDYALPMGGYCHQMFGRGLSIQENAAWEHQGDHMLLQLAYDDVMGWEFGDNGVFQFWISPEDLKLRNWSKVDLTFECH